MSLSLACDRNETDLIRSPEQQQRQVFHLQIVEALVHQAAKLLGKC